jgi:D-alanyl-D-alanine carboxypeptidase
MMTLRARALGMNRTVFRNASGLPDPDMWTTARDLALLARHILTDFPNEYGYFSTPSFVYHGHVVLNHDHMLQTYPGADGMKTGYTDASGHNLVTSARRDGVRLVGVVLGAASNPERDIHMASLLNDGFEREGVPVERREPMIANHFPSFIGHAQAASLHPPARGRHPAHRPAAAKGAPVHATKGEIQAATPLPLARAPLHALVHRTSFEHPATHHAEKGGRKLPATGHAHAKTGGKPAGSTSRG